MRSLAIVALAFAACTSTRAAAREDELVQARTQVVRFCAAVAASDCATVGELLPTAREPAACAKLLHAWRDDLRIQLIDVRDVRRDGRDRNAIIVRAAVLRHGAQQTMLVRVTHERGAWQLVM